MQNLINLIKIDKSELGFPEITATPTQEDMTKAIVVYAADGFVAQNQDGSNTNKIYYISKDKTVYTQIQLIKRIMESPEDKFLLISERDAFSYDIWTYVDSVDNNIQLSFYKFNGETGQMEKIAYMRNKPATSVWDEDLIQINEKFVSGFHKIESYYHESGNWQMEVQPGPGRTAPGRSSYNHSVNQFHVIGSDHDRGDTITNIMTTYLKLPGKTRIVSELEYHGIGYKVAVGEIAMADINTRYGIRQNDEEPHYCYDHMHFDELFDEGADLDEATWNRVSAHIKNTIEKGAGIRETIGTYRCKVDVQTKSMIVISEPIGMHRRPTFHYIKGFKHCDVIDIVELARGELLMKDMTPINCYYLTENGTYIRVSHSLFGGIKQEMMNGIEVDKVSFAERNESKSIHPKLLKAITAAGDAIRLSKVKLFNRVPFGALFLEHLVQGANYELAEGFAEYITQRADNMNYVCGSLSDVFPGCNPDGTSLMKVLNVNKPCFDLLMASAGNTADMFVTAYSAIKRLIPSGVVTKDTEKVYKQYIELYNLGWVQYHCRTGRIVDIVNYPNEIKSIYKMINRIHNAFPFDNWELERNYKEIVMAYFQFKDFGWDPAESQIFIEFGLGDLSETRKMFRDREHAANTALAIYRNKINELERQKAESHYANRLPVINKMLPTQTMIKESKSGLFKKYVLMAPTQIYGEDVVGSIEKEGADMDHCVYRSYAGQIAEGEYTVLYLRLANNAEESLVTIGITKEGRINQTFGKHDQTITSEQAAAIVEWACSRKGMVTFRSEHTNVNPGGWPRGVDVPSLPEPDADWLTKLATIEAI